MQWSELYPKTKQPDRQHISQYINNRLWDELCTYLEESYGVAPQIAHSICSGAPGWNVKYKKSSRALCTLYPADGYFTAMVSVGSKEATQAELMLCVFTEYVQKLYQSTKSFNGGRWLMIEVRSPEILDDVKQLIALRMQKKG